MARKVTRKETLQQEAERAGLYVATYSPGDGVTRYRFFREPSGYFGPHNGIFTALGLKEARAFIAGRRGHARTRGGTSRKARWAEVHRAEEAGHPIRHPRAYVFGVPVKGKRRKR